MSSKGPASGGIVDLGPDDDVESAALFKWSAEQEAKNLDRLEEGGRTLIQMVTLLYGLLFGVLALKDAPSYLDAPLVRLAGLGSVLLLGITLLAALVAVFPFAYRYHAYSITAREKVQGQILERKSRALAVALVSFVAALVAFAVLIAAALLR